MKARFHEEKKVIKEIIKENQFEVQVTSTLDEFIQLLNNDKRVVLLDPNNIKLVFNSLYEKAELKEKERLKEENKKVKKLEQNFKSLLKKLNLEENTKYEDIKDKISNEDAYLSIYSDKDRERLFDELMGQMQETCLHHIKKKKEKRKKTKRSRSVSSPQNDVSDDNSDEEMESRVSDKQNKKESRREDTRNNDDSNEEKMDDEVTASSHSKSNKKHKKSKKKKKQKSVFIKI